jgi:3-carboxy-cis,cis-muconate cycloisomerase
MAEAVMMALAPTVGRLRAHSAVSAACQYAREKGAPLADALAETLDPELLATLQPLESLLAPCSYLGESEKTVASACSSWKRQRERGDAGDAP